MFYPFIFLPLYVIITKILFFGGFRMRAVVTVIGKDNVGILHKVSGICTEYNANVIEVTQSVLQDMFAMIMLVDISGITKDFSEMVDSMTELGNKLGLSIHTMHEDVFNSMHSV